MLPKLLANALILLLALSQNALGHGKPSILYSLPDTAQRWKAVLTLDHARNALSGHKDSLASAIRRGADLRIYTEFRHNEHIDVGSDNRELVKEVADFRVTYLLDNSWVAGIINLRQPIELPDGFGPRPSMSFFLYNENGDQAIARPYLDNGKKTGMIGPSVPGDHRDMPKYHPLDAWDSGTNAPSSNFAYDFDIYKFYVSDSWKEIYANDAAGNALYGSVEALAKAFSEGREVKVGIKGLCQDLYADGTDTSRAVADEVFIHCGSAYYYTEKKQFMAASHPVVRVKPAIPLRYESRNWDFGWLMPRSDGHVALWLVDPYSLTFRRNHSRYAIRWFVR